jgi:hypothetical protein
VVLQIADILDLPAVAVKELMREAHGLPVDFGDQAVKILRVVAKKTREGGGMDNLGDRGLVIVEIPGPEPPPVDFVRGAQGADDDCGHETPHE